MSSRSSMIGGINDVKLSSAVQLALKQLNPRQRRKIEQEIKKQLKDENEKLVTMRYEIELNEAKIQKEIDKQNELLNKEKEEISSEQSKFKKERKELEEKRKLFNKQLDEMNAKRKDLDSQRRMLDAETSKIKYDIKSQKKRIDAKHDMHKQQRLNLLEQEEEMKKQNKKQ
eukprot:234977_1